MTDISLKCHICGATLIIATDCPKTIEKSKKAFERKHKHRKRKGERA